jgi:hypothetical protein
VAEDLLQPGPFGELVIDDGFHILSGLDLVQPPLQFFIVDAVEILLPQCRNVFLPLLSRTIDLSNEHLVSLALLRLCRPVQESVSASYLGVEGHSLLLLFNDFRVTRESIFDMPRDVLWGARIARDAHMCVKTRMSPSTDGRSITAV